MRQLQVMWVAGRREPTEIWVYDTQQVDWAADETTRKSVSQSGERYGQHVLGCTIAKLTQVAVIDRATPNFYGTNRSAFSVACVLALAGRRSGTYRSKGLSFELT